MMKRRRNSSATSGMLFDEATSSIMSGCLRIWLLFCLLARVSGHGFLSSPRSRNFVAYEDGSNEDYNAFDPLPEDCPHCLNRGGTLAACGVINPGVFEARNYDTPMSAIGYPLPVNSQASYIEQQVITVEVFLSEHQKGHMIFSACPVTDKEVPTQECFDQNRLKFVNDEFYGAPVDTNFPERVMVAPHSLPFRKTAFEDKFMFNADTSMLFRFQLQLPPNLTGSLVLLQWYYVESNDTCMHEGYDQYPWPQAWIDSTAKGEYVFDSGLENCADVLPPDGSEEGSQFPDQFWNCAEVAISPRAPVVEAKQQQKETEKTIIGYYASWQYYDRTNFAVPKNFDFTKYTRLNFAFFQINNEGDIWGTDEWADPITLFGEHDWAALEGREYCSWDGPNLKTCNRHFYEDGLIYQAKAAGAEVWPSIGGWSLSDPFPTMAASEASRENFANNCIKLIEEYGFDGIDIDWEYPGYEAHSGTPEDKGNYNLLLKKLREKLDELGNKSGKFYGLTAALPCGTNHIRNIDIKTVSKYLSELNLMTYDFFGAWSPTTGINAPLHDQSWGGEDTVGFSIDGCTKNWVAGGGDPSKINIGLPFYGRSFRGATGLNQEHDGKADDGMWHEDEGSPQYFNIVKKLEYKNEWSTDQQMHSYRHEETSTQYAWYNIYGGVGFVSYDDEEAICDKTRYCMENELNGFIIWEISGDLMLDGSTPLIDAVHTKLRDPSLDCKDFRYKDSLPPPSVTPTTSPSLRPTPRPTPVRTPNPTKPPTSPPVQPMSSSVPPPPPPPTWRPSIKPSPKPSSKDNVESIYSAYTSVQIVTPKPTKSPTPRPTVKMTPRPTRKPTSPRPTLSILNFLASSSSSSASASSFVAPTPYSHSKPRTRRPTRAPTPRLSTASNFVQMSTHMKGEDPKPSRTPLDPSISSLVASFVDSQSQVSPMKKASKKKKKQKKIVANSAAKKGTKKKKRPT